MTDLSDPRQFEAAYQRLAPRAFVVALSVLKDPAAAEDVVQDLFLGLWRNPRSYDPSRGSLETYIGVLARSRAIDRGRSRGAREAARMRLASQVRPAEADREPPAEHAAIEREQRRRLLSAVDDLPESQREAILLSYVGGLSASEIARRRAVPLGTAKSRIRIGLARARERLGEAA